MNMITMDSSKVRIFIIIGIVFIGFKNWMRYNGKRRNVLNATTKKTRVKPILLLILPIVFLVLIFLFYQAI